MSLTEIHAAGESLNTPTPREESPSRAPSQDNIALQLKDRALPDLIHSLTEKKKSGARFTLLKVSGDLHDYRATPYLVQAYEESKSDGIRFKLIESLGKIRDPSLFEWYIRRLTDPSIGIQCFAIWALGELRMPKSAEPIRRKLWSEHRLIQLTTIDALGKTGHNRDISAQLLIFLGDRDVEIRYLAAKSLAGTASLEDVPELMRRLLQEPSLDVQEELARTISQVGGSLAVGRFVELLQNPISQGTDHWAEVGLKSADPNLVIPAITPFIEGHDFRLTIAASHILSEIELIPQRDIGASWTGPVKRWAETPTAFTREAAIRLLKRIETMERLAAKESLK